MIFDVEGSVQSSWPAGRIRYDYMEETMGTVYPELTRTKHRPDMRTVCITGHKNPDTDSICSSLAYTYFKQNMKGKEQNRSYIACRAGAVSGETQYVLDYFHFQQPIYIDNIGTRVKDMDIHDVPGVRRNISVKTAWNLMKSQNVVTLPVTSETNELEGVITINDIAKSYMDENDPGIVAVAKTPYENILETLEAEMIVGDCGGNFESGKVIIAAANPDVMENYINPGDMVILGNRYESQLMAILAGAGCIVVCLGADVSRTIQHMAQEHNTTVIVSPLDTYTVARLINQSMPVSFFMKSERLVTFRLNDYTEQIREVMSKKRYRDFPIVDKHGHYIGMISRRNLLGVRKRELILLDHNEVSQAVDNVENADILEIIDHHRLGTLQTMNPVYFRNQPVGCTATIIYQLFHEHDLDIPREIAGLLCSAILSDTLVFRSPTCTAVDKAAAMDLASIAGIEVESYAKAMFAAGSDLRNKTDEEIFYNDFKTFENEDITIGIGQITSMSQDELDDILIRIKPYIEKVHEEKGLDLAFFMLTNIIEEKTTMICYGKKADMVVQDAFDVPVESNVTVMEGIVSRKKQVVPGLMSALAREAEES